MNIFSNKDDHVDSQIICMFEEFVIKRYIILLGQVLNKSRISVDMNGDTLY